MSLTSQEINLDDSIIKSEAIGSARTEPMVLNQSVLHDTEQCSAIRADCQSLHATVSLTSCVVAEQLRSWIGARIGNEEFRWDLDPPDKMTLPVEFK